MDAVTKADQSLTSSEIQRKSFYLLMLWLLFLGKTAPSFLYSLPFINVKAYWTLLVHDVVENNFYISFDFLNDLI